MTIATVLFSALIGCTGGPYDSGGSDQDTATSDCEERSWWADCDGDGAYQPEPYAACAPLVGPEAGCEGDHAGTWRDVEPEGAPDCDDADAARFPGQTWWVDCDGDGAYQLDPYTSCHPPEPSAVGCTGDHLGEWVHQQPVGDADCDDSDADLVPGQRWWADCDGDGAYQEVPIVSCAPDPVEAGCDGLHLGAWVHEQPDGDPDCDDADADRVPGQRWWADCDGDGAYQSDAHTSCAPDPVEAGCNGPHLGEWVDEQPVGDADCDDADADRFPGQRWWADCDGDGAHQPDAYTACAPPDAITAGCDGPHLGAWVHEQPVGEADCDDHDAAFFPGQPWWADCDGDGAYQPQAIASCVAPEPSEAGCTGDHLGEWLHAQPDEESDCDDADAERVPGQHWWADCDGDGAYQEAPIVSCAPDPVAAGCDGSHSGEWVLDQPGGIADCDDNDAALVPDQTWWADCDGDGFYQPEARVTCAAPEPADAGCEGSHDGTWSNVDPGSPYDCDDNHPHRFPGQTWWADCDGDGFYQADSVEACAPDDSDAACQAPYTPTWTHEDQDPLFDCDDADATAWPGAPELCDAQPNDCGTWGEWESAWEHGTVTQVHEGVSADVTEEWTSAEAYHPPGVSTTWLCEGDYHVQVFVEAPEVSLRALDGHEVTLDGSTLPGSIVTFGPGSSGSLVGLRLASGHAALGGAVHADEADVHLERMRLEDNTAEHAGGAVYSRLGAIVVRDSTFQGNTALGSESEAGGGAIHSLYGSVDIEGSHFLDNHAPGSGTSVWVGGGAVNMVWATTGRVVDSVFEGNTSVRQGGALRVFQTGGVLLEGANFLDNETTDDFNGAGGAVFYYSGDVDVRSSSFVGNKAGTGGGVFHNSHAASTVRGTLFQANDAREGGAWFGTYGGLIVEEETSFLENTGRGGALYLGHDHTVTCRDSAVIDNERVGLFGLLKGGAAWISGGEGVFRSRGCTWEDNGADDVYWNNGASYAATIGWFTCADGVCTCDLVDEEGQELDTTTCEVELVELGG